MSAIPAPCSIGAVETAARALNLEVVTSEIRRAEDIASAFDAFKGRVDALYVVAETLVNANRIRINTLAVGVADVVRSGK